MKNKIFHTQEWRIIVQDNNGRRVINIIFRVIIIGAFYTGIKAVYNFYMLMAQYPTLQGENLFSRVALLIDDYMFMIVLTVAAIIFNILTRKQIDSKSIYSKNGEYSGGTNSWLYVISGYRYACVYSYS